MNSEIEGASQRVKKATRSDVARLAGTSTAVVSYVVNDGPRPVAEATRKRVLDAIEELGYRPNSLARSLRSAQSETYGLVVPNLTNSFFAELAQEIESRAARAGKGLLIANSDEKARHKLDQVEMFLDKRVDGIILVGLESKSLVKRIQAFDVPVVVVDRPPRADLGIPTVTIDNRRATYEATTHLIEHGHRRIGFLAGPEGLSVANERLEGWRQALADNGYESSKEWVLHTPFEIEDGVRGTYELLGLPEPPTAIVCSSDQQALGVIYACRAKGIRVPEDCAVFSVDGTRMSKFENLSTIEQPLPEIADEAIRILLDPKGMRSHEKSVDFKVRIRTSCGCQTVGITN